MTNPKHDNAHGKVGEVGKAEIQPTYSIKKIDRVEAALKLPAGLNRFDAERIGDHVLNSTIAEIRKTYGHRLLQQWETVPSRYCSKGVRVLRYWLTGGGK